MKEGLFEPSIPHVIYRLTEIIFMHFLGVYFIYAADSYQGIMTYLLRALGILVLGIVQGRCGWFMHEGGHYSLTGYIVPDRYFPFFPSKNNK